MRTFPPPAAIESPQPATTVIHEAKVCSHSSSFLLRLRKTLPTGCCTIVYVCELDCTVLLVRVSIIIKNMQTVQRSAENKWQEKTVCISTKSLIQKVYVMGGGGVIA